MEQWSFVQTCTLYKLVSCTNLLSGCSKIRDQDCKYLFYDKTQIFVLCIFHRYPFWWNHLHMIELILQHLNSFHTNSPIINDRILTNIKLFYANLYKNHSYFYRNISDNDIEDPIERKIEIDIFCQFQVQSNYWFHILDHPKKLLPIAEIRNWLNCLQRALNLHFRVFLL